MDRISKAHRSWNMSRIRGTDTRPEMLVRSALHRMGFRFRLHVHSLPGRPDIVLPRWKAVILVNGCFWHRHRNCCFAYNPKSRVCFWQSKFDATIRRDRSKIKQLRRAGWKVLVIWECDLANHRFETSMKGLVRKLAGNNSLPTFRKIA